MDWDELKRIVSSSDKIIIIDQGKPSFVITTFDYYKNNFISSKDDSIESDEDDSKDVRKDVKNESIEDSDLTIDDLPF